MVLCVHSDADATTDTATFNHKIKPAFDRVTQEHKQALCKNLVPIVPVQMIEAWLLADIPLFKAEIGTTKNDEELGLHKPPERYTDPKQVIQMAIRIACQALTKRRRRDVTIGELYQPIGRKIDLSKLETLPSYRKFKAAVREAFKALNYLF